MNYVKERNCLRDKFSQYLQIFTKFAKLNPREKSTGSQLAKLNPREKKFFFSFLRISKTYIFTLGSLLINDGHVKNILQVIKQSRITFNYHFFHDTPCVFHIIFALVFLRSKSHDVLDFFCIISAFFWRTFWYLL